MNQSITLPIKFNTFTTPSAHRARTAAVLAAVLLVAASLSACGGGDAGGEMVATPGGTPTGGAPAGACPTATVNDVWMDQRLGCIATGARFIDVAAGYGSPTTTYADTAYVMNETAYDRQFNNILGTTQNTRFWSHFLCVRNAPQLPAGGGYQLGLATDLQRALGLGNFDARLPRGIGAVTLGAYTGGQSGVVFAVNETCDPAKHPVIVDYASGLVKSLNPGALALQVAYTR